MLAPSQRFGAMADQAAIARDLEKAIQLARADEDGRTLTCGGIDCKQQRLFVLAWCHHQRACMAMDAADQPRARWAWLGAWAVGCSPPGSAAGEARRLRVQAFHQELR